MRWLIATLATLGVLLVTFPVLASGSSDGPGQCTSAVGLRTLGDSETCDTWSVVVSLPSAVLVFLLILWAGRLLARHASSEDPDPGDPDD